MKDKQFMQAPATERRIVNGALWFFAACVLVIVLTSCSPYAGNPANLQNSTPTPSATATAFHSANLHNGNTPTPPPPACTVTGYLNLRTKPSRRGALVIVLTKGERVTILRRVGDWMNVQTRDNKAGFIYGKFCR